MSIKNFFVGILMGVCDLVPGVSGGTIALITGVYETLLTSIKNVLHVDMIKLVFSGNIKEARKVGNGNFLLLLFLGILTSVVLFSKVLEHSIETSPQLVRGFFLGLVIASIVLLVKKELSMSFGSIVALCGGIGVAILISMITPTASEPSTRYIIVSAAIGICAMILPGISGSFLLLILGMYIPLLAAISDRDVVFLGLFVMGALIGLALFSRVISYFISTHRVMTLAVLIGFMIGSLPILWPWQNTALLENGEKEVTYVLPGEYEKNNNLVFVFLLFFVGLVGGTKVFNKFDQVN